jgi:hypothetical protein
MLPCVPRRATALNKMISIVATVRQSSKEWIVLKHRLQDWRDRAAHRREIRLQADAEAATMHFRWRGAGAPRSQYANARGFLFNISCICGGLVRRGLGFLIDRVIPPDRKAR